VIITETISAAVYIEDEETWYRIYNEPRKEAVLTDAYDTIREIRDEDSLFDRYALSVSEAIFNANRPSGEESSGYEEGDTFDCPVCGQTHTVQFHENELMENHETDSSELYVECSDASGDKLHVEFQANTPS
jgi:DNA repair exonuclease SbcCD ATPase subunit